MRPAKIALCFLLVIPAARADESLRQCMREAAVRLHFNGVAYAGRLNDVTEEVFGTSDQNQTIPVQPSTKFNIGSAGKMFTAVAIGQLVDRGLIRLDVPVGTYLDKLQPEIAAITVRQLLGAHLRTWRPPETRKSRTDRES